MNTPRRNHPSFKIHYANFRGERGRDEGAPSDAALTTGKRRRRIEDVLEASRLEREALYEVWEL